MAFETSLEPWLVVSLTVGLGRDHVDDLASARDQIGERADLRIRHAERLAAAIHAGTP